MDRQWSDKYAKPGGTGGGREGEKVAGLGGAKSGTAGRAVKGHDESSDYSEDADWGGEEAARDTKKLLESKK